MGGKNVDWVPLLLDSWNTRWGRDTGTKGRPIITPFFKERQPWMMTRPVMEHKVVEGKAGGTALLAENPNLERTVCFRLLMGSKRVIWFVRWDDDGQIMQMAYLDATCGDGDKTWEKELWSCTETVDDVHPLFGVLIEREKIYFLMRVNEELVVYTESGDAMTWDHMEKLGEVDVEFELRDDAHLFGGMTLYHDHLNVEKQLEVEEEWMWPPRIVRRTKLLPMPPPNTLEGWDTPGVYATKSLRHLAPEISLEKEEKSLSRIIGVLHPRGEGDDDTAWLLMEYTEESTFHSKGDAFVRVYSFGEDGAQPVADSEVGVDEFWDAQRAKQYWSYSRHDLLIHNEDVQGRFVFFCVHKSVDVGKERSRLWVLRMATTGVRFHNVEQKVVEATPSLQLLDAAIDEDRHPKFILQLILSRRRVVDDLGITSFEKYTEGKEEGFLGNVFMYVSDESSAQPTHVLHVRFEDNFVCDALRPLEVYSYPWLVLHEYIEGTAEGVRFDSHTALDISALVKSSSLWNPRVRGMAVFETQRRGAELWFRSRHFVFVLRKQKHQPLKRLRSYSVMGFDWAQVSDKQLRVIGEEQFLNH